MPTETLLPASGFSDEHLHAAFTVAFSDYAVPMRMPLEAFRTTMRMRSLSPEHSRVAVVDGGIAAFWLIGTRARRAYLIASGTDPRHRRRALSRRLGEAVVSSLADQAFATLQAEVLEDNSGARRLYRALGMDEGRTLDVFSLPSPRRSAPMIDAVEVTDGTAVPKRMEALWDGLPSWQNETEALAAAGPDATCFSVWDRLGPAGVVLLHPKAQSLAQIAVRPDRRRRGLATALLAHACRELELDGLRATNVDRADSGLTGFLRALGAERVTTQKELMLRF